MNSQITKENLIDIEGATVAFYNFNYNGKDTLCFNTSKSTPPHPMVNAMAGLKVLKDNQQLVMINHHSPDGLFAKIDANFNYDVEDLEDGTVKIVFTPKAGTTAQTDFNDNQCGGGCDH